MLSSDFEDNYISHNMRTKHSAKNRIFDEAKNVYLTSDKFRLVLDLRWESAYDASNSLNCLLDESAEVGVVRLAQPAGVGESVAAHDDLEKKTNLRSIHVSIRNNNLNSYNGFEDM